MFRKQSWHVCLILVIALTAAACQPASTPAASPAAATVAAAISTASTTTVALSTTAPTQAPATPAIATAAAVASPTTAPAQATPTGAPTSAPSPTRAASAAPVSSPVPGARARVEVQPVPQGPTLLRAGITLRKVIGVGEGDVKLALNPTDGALYYLHPANGLFRVQLVPTAATIKVASKQDIVPDGNPSGMTFGPDGSVYVVVNRKVDSTHTQAIIRKGTPGGQISWSTLASTEPYQLSNTNFDHLYNGIAVSPDGKWVFLNAGSRTDHGEVESGGDAFPDLREVPLTSAILRVPADARDLTLPADENALKPYLYADGTRNAYDIRFAPNGDLFAVDNGPDADYPDELNWIRQGLHYGFPWRFGNQDNPQQFSNYDGGKDVRLSMDFVAVKTGTYKNDPGFPKPPTTFTDPVVNLGPDAAQYRGDDGQQHDAAAEGKTLLTFTPHRSPLGLAFVSDPKMPTDLRSNGNTLSAFLLSWGAAGGTLTDKGQDLLQIRLTKRGDNYEAVTSQFARGFNNPIDAVTIENRLYVLEYGRNAALWELTFE
jgi:glucose/arabinose dehydrogenase